MAIENKPVYPSGNSPNSPNYVEQARPVIIVDAVTGKAVSFGADLSSEFIKTSFGDSAALDAFARLRVSNPTTLFDAQLEYDDSPLFWETVLTNNGTTTHLPNESSLNLNVTTTNTDAVVRQTRKYFRYQPGKSQQILLTALFDDAQANLHQSLGYFDSNDGIFFELTEDGLFVVLRSSTTGGVSNTRMLQSDWNIDTFDGNGISGHTIDITKAQLFFIDLEWLSIGRVRTGFFIGGVPHYGHEFLNANLIGGAYMKTANLPVCYMIENIGAIASAASMKQICTAVVSEGGIQEATGIPFHQRTTAFNSVTTVEPVLSIRPKLLFNGIANRADIEVTEFAIFTEDENAHFHVVYGGTLTDPSWVDVNATYSSVEYDQSASAISGGIVVAGGFVEATNQGNRSFSSGARFGLLSKLPLTLNRAGAHPTSPLSDVITIVAVSLAAAAAATDVQAHFEWIELR